jgi:voltage-dependent calcium channel L type alpha-1S
LRDPLHKLDLILIIYQVIDVITYFVRPNLNENYYYNLINCLLAFRFLHLSRGIEFTKTILSLIRQTWVSFLSIAFLLVVLILIYAVIGVQIFAGTLPMNTIEGQMKNFETCQSAVMTVFNVVTIDNWFLLYVLANKHIGIFKSLFFFYTLIIIGNFIFLRIFVATMLDGFEHIKIRLRLLKKWRTT